MTIDPPAADLLTNEGIARAAQALPQRQRLRGVCAACRSVFSIKIDRSTLSFDPVV